MVLFPPPFYFVFDISNLLSYIQIISSYELARPVMGTIFLVSMSYPGTMAKADVTTSTHDEGQCWEEGLHSLSCSEDEDRGELV